MAFFIYGAARYSQRSIAMPAPTTRLDQQPSGLPKLLSVKQLTDWLGISRAALYKAIAENRFPQPLKLGRQCVRFREDQVIAALEKQGSEGGAA